MCSKGSWVRDMTATMSFSGFFRLSRERADAPLMLSDASGSIRAIPNDGLQVNHMLGKVVFASGLAEHMNPASRNVRVVAAIPAIRWTGNPFALAEGNPARIDTVRRLAWHVEHIRDASLRRLIGDVFADHAMVKPFLRMPASLSHHHAFPGGLACHTLEVMDIAEPITQQLDQYEHDMVMTACLLHDAGKSFEYQQSGKWLSARGKFLGHEITLLELLAPVADRIWSRGDPKRIMIFHLLTAKPAPQWTGIRHPRTRLVNILRFADRWSIEGSLEKVRKQGAFPNARIKSL